MLLNCEGKLSYGQSAHFIDDILLKFQQIKIKQAISLFLYSIYNTDIHGSNTDALTKLCDFHLKYSAYTASHMRSFHLYIKFDILMDSFFNLA